MTEPAGYSRVWPVALWAALLSGVVVAWSPRYWAVSVAVTTLSAVAVCRIAALRRDWSVTDLPGETALVALIGAWGFLQIAFHKTVLHQSTLDNSLVWALSGISFILGGQILRGRRSRMLFLELLMWSSTALALIAMLQFYGTPNRVFGIFPAVEDVFGTFLSYNQFAALMELAAPVALWYMVKRHPAAGGLCYAMILAATITAASRAGAILVGAELLVFLGLILTTRRREAKANAFIFVGLGLLVAVAAIVANTDAVRVRFEEQDPYTIRRELLDSTLTLISAHPWSGYGMGTWRAVYPRAATFDLGLLANEAHNDWAQWTCDGGVLFTLLMAALVIRTARPAMRSIWGLGTLSVMAHSWVDYPIREPALSFLWFTLAGAVCQVAGSPSELRRDAQEPEE